MAINDYGDTSEPLNNPPFGGPSGWAAAVSAALNGSDTTVDARIATHSADSTDVHGIPDTADLTTAAELEAYAAARATVGNLLTDNVASGTDTLGTTEGFASVSGATLSSTTNDPLTGARALRAQATVDGNASYVSCPSDQLILVVPGQTMTLRAMITTPSHTGEEWAARVEFAGVTTLIGTQILVNNIDYTEVAWTGVVPEGATTLRWHFRRMVGVNGAVGYLDSLSLHVGAGGDWAMPGTPITGTGTRITRPNIDDRLVEQWNGSAWSVVDYDSGWRDVSSLLTNGWNIDDPGTINRAVARRMGNQVQFYWRNGTPGTTTSGTIIWDLPAGFTETGLIRNQYMPWISTTGASGALSLDADELKVQAAPTSGSLWFGASWVTDDLPPTSLPGTLATPAPELEAGTP